MRNQELETGYLVVGTGAVAMAFVDALRTHSEATVTIAATRRAGTGSTPTRMCVCISRLPRMG
ncbi:hypothetical protein [Gemmatimonas sp.]|uniref:hypothetical protein n=1 Tax=Gemmatimonas sp. TaxID=1962908 RepID=UPI0035667775